MPTDQEIIERRDVLKAQLETKQLEAQIATYEMLARRPAQIEAMEMAAAAAASRDGWAYTDPPYGSFSPLSIDGPNIKHAIPDSLSSRERGANKPFVHTESDLNYIRGIARVISEVDESGVGILNALTSYTAGTGFEYEATAKDNREGAEPIAARAQLLLDQWYELDKWRRKERELIKRDPRDGEWFAYVKPLGGGKAKTQIIEPINVTEPTNAQQLSEFLGQSYLDWSFGIATEVGDPEMVYGYFVQWDSSATNWDILTPDEMVHCKSTVEMSIKRGVSEYYGVYRTLAMANEVYRKSGRGASNQAAIAYIREHSVGVTDDQVTKLVRTMSSTVDGSGNLVVEYPAGQVVDIPNGTKFHYGPMGTSQAPAFLEIANGLYQHAGVRWNMPSYLVTGDVDSPTFAGVLVAESPFIMGRLAKQAFLSETFQEICWAILRIAVNDGLFSAYGIETIEQLKQAIQVDVKPPQIIMRNRLEETQINQTLNERGILSRQTWANREDLDYESEAALIEQAPPVSGPMQTPPNMTTTAYAPGQPSPASLTESQRIEAAARMLLWGGYP